MDRLKKMFILMTLTALALQLSVVKVSTAFAYSTGDVVINEIAWAGTADSSTDEWIELYNTTNQTIDLTGWKIVDDGSSTYEITAGSIAPHGYFVIEDSEETIGSLTADAVMGVSLANAGDSLVLMDSADIIIDTVNGSGGAWYAGDSTSKATMERIDPSTTTDSADNWADALNSNGETGAAGSEILGTPGSANSNYAGSGTEVSIIPSENNVTAGEQFTVNVNVDSAADLYAYGFELNYDSAVLDFISATEGTFLAADGATTAFNAALENGQEGTLVVGNARLANPPAGIDGSGNLFTVTFSAIGSDGSATNISFGSESFLSDSLADIAAGFNGGSVSVGSGSVVSVSNLLAEEGQDRFSIDLSWSNPDAAESFIVKRQKVDGSLETLGEVTGLSFTDNSNLVPGVTYSYQVVAVKSGSTGSPVAVTGSDTRGLSGDLDRSDRVDGRDLELLARSYGSEYIDEEYDPLKDTNFDGVIDGSDLINIGANFGLTYQ